jgi:hypothetical protein
MKKTIGVVVGDKIDEALLAAIDFRYYLTENCFSSVDFLYRKSPDVEFNHVFSSNGYKIGTRLLKHRYDFIFYFTEINLKQKLDNSFCFWQTGFTKEFLRKQKGIFLNKTSLSHLTYDLKIQLPKIYCLPFDPMVHIRRMNFDKDIKALVPLFSASEEQREVTMQVLKELKTTFGDAFKYCIVDEKVDYWKLRETYKLINFILDLTKEPEFNYFRSISQQLQIQGFFYPDKFNVNDIVTSIKSVITTGVSSNAVYELQQRRGCFGQKIRGLLN